MGAGRAAAEHSRRDHRAGVYPELIPVDNGSNLLLQSVEQPRKGVDSTQQGAMERPAISAGAALQLRDMWPTRVLGRARLRLVPLFCIAFTCVSAAFAQDRPLILEDVTVIDGTGNPPRQRVSILIQDGRVTAVGAKESLPHPPMVETKHLPGRFVMPGLIDMHAHVTIIMFGGPGGTPSSQQHYDRKVSEQVLRTLLAFGVTSVRNPAAPSAEGVKLRDDVAAGKIPGPRIFTAGEALDHLRGRHEPFVYVGSEQDVRREVERQARQRIDFIKLYASLPPRLAATAIRVAHAHGLKVIGHLGKTSWKEAANLGIDGICHGASWDSATLPPEKRSIHEKSSKPYLLKRLDWLEEIDLGGREIGEMISALVEHHVIVDPTLIAYETKFRASDAFYIESPDLTVVPEPILNMWRRGGSVTSDWTREDHERARSLWPKLLSLIKLYYDRGVRLVAGSDLPNPWVSPGASLHRELELLASAGIPPRSVIQMATQNAAEALGISAEVGTAEAGKWADLVVLTANPLEKIENTRKIELVTQRGRIVDTQPTMNRP